MTLTEKLPEAPRKPTGTPCSIGAIIAQLEGTDEGEALRQMMYVLGWSQAKIYHALRAEKFDPSEQQINRHRSQSCRCWK